ncbi:MAG: alpha amylase N-terminal ig-like domain-containing protein, partial [Lachnospiraceae bacterium]|nr:alpha amylase N-terminal ig-like domain-containing protein [Lachnospiraceae bacterium]
MDFNPEYERSHQSQKAFEMFVPAEPQIDNSSTGYMTENFIGRAVYSDGSSRYRFPAEPENGDTVKIRIRVARGNASAVVLVVDTMRRVMSIVKSDAMFDYYEAEFTLGDTKVEYYFIIHCDYKVYYYNRIGVNQKYYPEYNLRIIPGFKTPDWAKGAVMYQIFTDRFCDGTTFNNVESNEYFYLDSPVKRIYNWSKVPDLNGTIEFYGGDLQGVWSKLDYLQWLGVEVIYFNPLFVSPSNHKYDTQDYDHIDPHFAMIMNDGGKLLEDGDSDNSHAAMYIRRVTDHVNLDASNEYFARFVAEAHRRGMKVILDGVFNHCGSFNKWPDRQLIYDNVPGYEKGAYRDKNSPYHSFFKFFSDNWP